MDNLGLEDGDDALQYALMLSMDEREQGSTIDDGYQPVVGADIGTSVTGDNVSVSGDNPDDDTELQEMLEEIRLAEERERERDERGA